VTRRQEPDRRDDDAPLDGAEQAAAAAAFTLAHAMPAPRWDDSGAAAASLVDDAGGWAAQVHAGSGVQGPAVCSACGRGDTQALGAGTWTVTHTSGGGLTRFSYELHRTLCGAHFGAHIAAIIDPDRYDDTVMLSYDRNGIVSIRQAEAGQ